LELITSGEHNLNLEASRTRIINNGSWKKQRVVVIIPSAHTIPAKVYLSHVSLMFPPNQAVFRYLALGTEVGDAFSTAIEQILVHPELSTWEYVLSIEHDNMPPPDGVVKLMERLEQNPHFAAVSGLYWTKGFGGVPQIWGDIKDPVQNYRPQAPVPGQLVECWGLGMGFALYRMEMFKDKRFPKPFFKTKCSAAEGVGTQDLAFWAEARKLGYRCAVDCAVLVGHHDHAGDKTW
jgi:hypothetical protein